jgi:hypothetical protein
MSSYIASQWYYYYFAFPERRARLGGCDTLS